MKDLAGIEAETRRLQGASHSIELQSFRGLAALIVSLHHCSFYYNYAADARKAAEIALNAHAAVVSFFVLSGFVLTLSLRKKPISPESAKSFYIRRAFRLYPALWVACLISMAYILAFRGDALPAWVSSWWSPSIRNNELNPLKIVAGFLSLTELQPTPIWSLFIEFCGSAVMPLVALLLFQKPRLFCIAVIACAGFSFTYGEQTRFAVGVYLLDFLLGAAIWRLLPSFNKALNTDFSTRLAAFAALLTLWFGRQIGGWTYGTYYHNGVAQFIEAIAATALIGIIYARPGAFRLLRWAPVAWLGDISYSFYLIHASLMALIAGVGGEWLQLRVFTGSPLVGVLALTACTLAISLPLAALSYRFVEVPGMKLGKWVSRNRSAKAAEPTASCTPTMS